MSLLFFVIVVGGGLWFLRSVGRASPKDLKKIKSQGLGIAVLALAAFLAVRGNIEAALGLMAVGLGLLNKDKLLPEFMRRGQAQTQSERPPANRQGASRMDRTEALRVLGLREGASLDDIRNAHKRLLKDYHPDKGGTNYLAAKINEAKDVLT
jgi:DnaJ family protein C protein 19